MNPRREPSAVRSNRRALPSHPREVAPSRHLLILDDPCLIVFPESSLRFLECAASDHGGPFPETERQIPEIGILGRRQARRSRVARGPPIFAVDIPEIE